MYCNDSESLNSRLDMKSTGSRIRICIIYIIQDKFSEFYQLSNCIYLMIYLLIHKSLHFSILAIINFSLLIINYLCPSFNDFSKHYFSSILIIFISCNYSYFFFSVNYPIDQWNNKQTDRCTHYHPTNDTNSKRFL